MVLFVNSAPDTELAQTEKTGYKENGLLGSLYL